jgi:hypothetical protein
LSAAQSPRRRLYFHYKLDSEKSFVYYVYLAFWAVGQSKLSVKLDNPLTQGTRAVFVTFTVSMAPVTGTRGPQTTEVYQCLG